MVSLKDLTKHLRKKKSNSTQNLQENRRGEDAMRSALL